MNRLFTKTGWIIPSAALVFSSAVWIGTLSSADNEEVGVQTKRVSAEMLGNVPGKNLTAIVVSYAPGGKSGAHRHAGSVFAYVLSGAIRSENSATGTAKVYKAGKSFFEPPGSRGLRGKCKCAARPREGGYCHRTNIVPGSEASTI